MSHAVKPEVIVLQSKYESPPPVTLFSWNVCLERVISTLYQRTCAKEAQSQQFGSKTWDGHSSLTSVTEDLKHKILAVLKHAFTLICSHNDFPFHPSTFGYFLGAFCGDF